MGGRIPSGLGNEDRVLRRCTAHDIFYCVLDEGGDRSKVIDWCMAELRARPS